MFRSNTVFYLLTVFSACYGAVDISKYLKVCDRNAIDVNDCMADAVQKGIAVMVNGIEELGVPPIDPYLQKDFRVEYKNNQVPTLRNLLPVVREDLGYDGSREHLRKILHSLGFSYKKCKTDRSSLIEKPNIAAKREHYLKIIMDNRNLPPELQKDIIYLDESYIHSSYKLKKCWQSIDVSGVKHNVSKGKRYIIVHAGSEKGFVPNALLIFSGTNKNEDYHSEMNKNNFTKWVTEKLIPNLRQPSIIVMDNAPYHSVVLNKAPTSASKVAEIKVWLLQNNIPFDESLRKPQLLMLVKRHKPEPIYEIDQILGDHGHTVVRLPPYHCDLNPIELIWGIAKHKIASVNVGSIDIKIAVKLVLKNIYVEGLKTATVHDARLRADDDKFYLEVDLTSPKVEVRSDYYGEGQFNSLKVVAYGGVNTTMNDLVYTWKISGVPEKKGNETYVRIKEFYMRPDVGKLVTYFRNDNPESRELTDLGTRFANENWRTLYKEFLPYAQANWNKIGVKVANKLFLKVPYDQLVPASS